MGQVTDSAISVQFSSMVRSDVDMKEMLAAVAKTLHVGVTEPLKSAELPVRLRLF